MEDCPAVPRQLQGLMEAYERQLIEVALAAAGGHQLRAAASLGIGPSTLSEKIRRLGLRRSPPLRSGRRRAERGAAMSEVIQKRFESPDESRRFEKGRLDIVRIGGLTLGRAHYEPGWKWSEHVGPTVGARRCTVEHVGLVLAGTATVAFEDGRVIELREGALFHVPPVPHDSWVVGDKPYTSLHFLGADQYAKK